MAGIGCHGMALSMPARRTQTISHMGGEGVAWIGQAPFTNEKHVFQNLGDGTYTHSGLLALRAAAAAGVNITYKILYNDAVAMTGGQPAEGGFSVAQIAHQVAAEGAKRLAIVTDEPAKYPANYLPAAGDRPSPPRARRRAARAARHPGRHRPDLRPDLRRRKAPPPQARALSRSAEARLHQRARLRRLRRLLAGVELRLGAAAGDRTRPQAPHRPVQLQQGLFLRRGLLPELRHRAWRQAAQGRPHRGRSVGAVRRSAAARARRHSTAPFNILVTGIGGTGVITIGALLGMAAHVDGKACSTLDFTGLSQKNGAVMSHVRIAPSRRRSLQRPHRARQCQPHPRLRHRGRDHRPRRCAAPSAASPAPSSTPTCCRPRASSSTPTSISRWARCAMRSMARSAQTDLDILDATGLATALMGDSIATNAFMLGFAFQRGAIPLSLEAIQKAIELNGAAIEMNTLAFAWGRLAAHDLQRVVTAARFKSSGAAPAKKTLDETIAFRAEFLTDYQDEAYANRYLADVERVRAAEAKAAPGSTELTEAFAKGLFKLMAYKDEYEVARLYSDGEFAKALQAQFDGDPGLKVLLAPPLIARRDKVTGHLQKREFGPWMFRAFGLLAKLKGLRGTALDIFGYTAERKMERALPGEYTAMIFRHLDGKRRPAAAGGAGQNAGSRARLWPHQGSQCRALPRRMRAHRGRGRPAGGAGGGVGRADAVRHLRSERPRAVSALRAIRKAARADRVLRPRRLSHLAHERASFDAAQSDAVAERVPRRRYAAHPPHPARRAGLCAADASSAAARRRNLHARSSQRRPHRDRHRPRRLAA